MTTRPAGTGSSTSCRVRAETESRQRRRERESAHLGFFGATGERCEVSRCDRRGALPSFKIENIAHLRVIQGVQCYADALMKRRGWKSPSAGTRRRPRHTHTITHALHRAAVDIDIRHARGTWRCTRGGRRSSLVHGGACESPSGSRRRLIAARAPPPPQWPLRAVS